MRIRSSEFAQCTKELIAWEHTVFNAIQAGDELPFDPFYARNAELTHDVVTACIIQHEANLEYEIQNFPLYHALHQHVPGYVDGEPDLDENKRYWSTRLRTQRWDKLPYQQQLAIVQGMDRIMSAHRMTDEEIEAERLAIAEAQREREENLRRDPHYYDNNGCDEC